MNVSGKKKISNPIIWFLNFLSVNMTSKNSRKDSKSPKAKLRKRRDVRNTHLYKKEKQKFKYKKVLLG